MRRATRRSLFVFVFAALAPSAGAAPPAADLFTTLASALSEGDAFAFMRPFDRAMPGVESLRANVTALVLRAEVLASLEITRDEGDDAHRSIEIEWYLRIRDKEETGSLTRRQETVKCRLEHRGKKWVIMAFEPLSLFAPPGVR